MMSSLSPCFSAKPRVTIMAKPASLFASMMAWRQAFCADAGMTLTASARTAAHHFPIGLLPYSEIRRLSCQPDAARAMRLVSEPVACWLFRVIRRRNLGEAGRGGMYRGRLDRRPAHRDARAFRAGRQTAPLRHPARPAPRGAGGVTTRHRRRRITRHQKKNTQ